MGGQPDVCPICATPYDPSATSDDGTIDVTVPDELDLRVGRADPDTPGSDEPGNPDGELATTSVGAESAEARPARSRPKTPLRPYVPPASAEGVLAPAEDMTADGDPFAAGLASRAASLPHRTPSAGAAAAGPGPERAPDAVVGPVTGPEPSSPPHAAAVGPSPIGVAGAGGGPIEAPAWAASPPPHGSPFAGIAPPGSDRPPPTGPPAVGIPGPPPTEAVPAPASPVPASAEQLGISARPDPYAQITNPLHTGWGTTPPPTTAPTVQAVTPTATPTRPRRRRLIVTVVVLALLVGGLLWQRDRVGDLVDDIRARISGDSAAALIVPAPVGTGDDGTNPAHVLGRSSH